MVERRPRCIPRRESGADRSCAIGAIDRTIYPGVYRVVTAIRFESLRVW